MAGVSPLVKVITCPCLTGSDSPSPAAGDMYGPQFLIDYDLIIVTVNYRLGPLGQLSLDTGLVSGNQVSKPLKYLNMEGYTLFWE